MPTYEYKCLKCGNQFEIMLPVGKKDAEQKCLECGHPETEKLLSAPSIILKGKGFHKTDYAKKSEKCETCPANKECKK